MQALWSAAGEDLGKNHLLLLQDRFWHSDRRQAETDRLQPDWCEGRMITWFSKEGKFYQTHFDGKVWVWSARKQISMAEYCQLNNISWEDLKL